MRKSIANMTKKIAFKLSFCTHAVSLMNSVKTTLGNINL